MLLLLLVVGPEQKPERQPGQPMTRLVVRESGTVHRASRVAQLVPGGVARDGGVGVDVVAASLGERLIDNERAIAIVAKRKSASTVSGEQSDRPLSAGASRPTGL